MRKTFWWKKYNKTTYNAYVIPVIEPIQDLYTAANNNIYISHLLIKKISKQTLAGILSKKKKKKL